MRHVLPPVDPFPNPSPSPDSSKPDALDCLRDAIRNGRSDSLAAFVIPSRTRAESLYHRLGINGRGKGGCN